MKLITRKYPDCTVYGGVIKIDELREKFKIPNDARVTISVADGQREITIHVSEIDVYWQRLRRAAKRVKRRKS